MGILSRIFGRSKPINVVAPLDSASGKYVLTETVRVKWRPVQSLPASLREQLLEVCRDNPCVGAAFFLDVLEQPTGDIKLWVSLTLDDPTSNLDRVARQMQEVLGKHTEYANRFFIGADLVDEVRPEQAAYRRAS